jgi:hypothetical protein
LPFKARHDSERWGLVRVTQKNVVRHLLSEAKERGMFSVVTRSLLILHRGRTLDKLRAAALHRPRGRAARARREMSTGTVLPAGRAAAGAPQEARPQTRELDASSGLLMRPRYRSATPEAGTR